MSLHRANPASARLRRAVEDRAGRARLRDAPQAPRVGSIVGVEHEYVVELEGEQVDFRHLIHRLDVPGRRIDAADRHAYRGAWGGTITADGREAEIATPPSTVGPYVGQRAARLAAEGAQLLLRALLRGPQPGVASIRGYSTHLSVHVPRGTEARAARWLAERHGATVAWLLDGPESPGILFRPRPGRVELGGDFVDGERLALAAVFAVGLVREAVARTTGLGGGARWWVARLRLRRRPSTRPAAAVDRFGWFVGDAELGMAFHGGVEGRDRIAAAWAAARSHLLEVDDATLRSIDLAIARMPAWLPGTG